MGKYLWEWYYQYSKAFKAFFSALTSIASGSTSVLDLHLFSSFPVVRFSKCWYLISTTYCSMANPKHFGHTKTQISPSTVVKTISLLILQNFLINAISSSESLCLSMSQARLWSTVILLSLLLYLEFSGYRSITSYIFVTSLWTLSFNIISLSTQRWYGIVYFSSYILD